MKKHLFLSVALGLWSLGSLTGCAVLDPGPPLTQVILPVRHTVAEKTDRLPARILVSQPVTDSATSTDRILALKDGYEVFALSSAKWVSSVPWMVQRLVIDALEARRRFDSAGWEESIFNANIRLQTDIRRFYLRYAVADSPPAVDIVFVFTLVDMQSGDTFARTLVAVEQTCAANNLKEFVAAYSIAMNKALDQCGSWVVANVEKRFAASAPQ